MLQNVQWPSEFIRPYVSLAGHSGGYINQRNTHHQHRQPWLGLQNRLVAVSLAQWHSNRCPLLLTVLRVEIHKQQECQNLSSKPSSFSKTKGLFSSPRRSCKLDEEGKSGRSIANSWIYIKSPSYEPFYSWWFEEIHNVGTFLRGDAVMVKTACTDIGIPWVEQRLNSIGETNK